MRHALTCMPLIPLLLMTCPEMSLVGLHTDLQMLFAQAEHKKTAQDLGGQRQENCLNIGDANKS